MASSRPPGSAQSNAGSRRPRPARRSLARGVLMWKAKPLKLNAAEHRKNIEAGPRKRHARTCYSGLPGVWGAAKGLQIAPDRVREGSVGKRVLLKAALSAWCGFDPRQGRCEEVSTTMSDVTTNYEQRQPVNGVPIKSWTRGVPVEDEAIEQLSNIARLPFVHRWVAAMPDVHLGIGATVGSVIPTLGAIIPAAVGVDIGCGMMAVQTTLTASDLPDNLAPMRSAIERAVPHGRTRHGGKRRHRRVERDPEPRRRTRGRELEPGYEAHRRQASERSRRATTSSTSARSAPATTSSRCASTRRTASGSCCTAARAASATASAATSSSWRKEDMRRHMQQPARRGPRVPRGGHASTSTTTSRRCSGRSASRARTAS